MTDKDTLQQHISDQKETQDTPAPKSGRPVLVWIAVLLALLSWVAMMFVSLFCVFDAADSGAIGEKIVLSGKSILSRKSR